MSNYSFDTVQQLLNEFNSWRKDDAAYAQCRNLLKDK
jgi:hypothetical protein